ncbi:MAG: polymer-forming cytoskeletal protein [Rhodospirillales bacterium]|nr:polymer-forming cytoskeletal protein [Rhodospirillales bacterium]
MFRRNKDNGDDDGNNLDAPPLKPFASKGTHTPSKPPTKAPNLHSGGAGAASQKRPVDIPSAPSRLDRQRPGEGDGKRLVVGRDIRLSGEITACERLIVEGHVEVSLSNARLIEVAPSGVFKGRAEVEDADISGHVDGELIVSNKLTVRSGGKISGSVHYGSIIIEAGGEVCGDMHALDVPARTATPAATIDGSDGIDKDADPA